MKRILWFRRDLRVEDNTLLSLGGDVLPIFIFDTNILLKLERDDKRTALIFLHVKLLKEKLKAIGLDLKIFYGTPQDVFAYLLKLYDFKEVAASGDYDEYAKNRDREISHLLHFHYLYDTYIFKPKEVLKSDGTPYLVFTPFYKQALKLLVNKDISKKQIAKHTLLASDYDLLTSLNAQEVQSKEISLENIGFKNFDITMQDSSEKLKSFKNRLLEYENGRDYLDLNATSQLGFELRFGVVGIRMLLREMMQMNGSEAFIRQLIFRDFYAYLLFHFPSLAWQNYKYSFNGIQNSEYYECFCNAATGVPIVDAAVRELLVSGNMHNRARMIAASFFTKDLLLPWQWGDRFFAQHLLDYDAASNTLSWQWSAGTGIDPQPYFRIFNPYLQSKKFDKEGKYIKKWLPQLQDIDAKYLHDEEYLLHVNIPNYPKPMVNHKVASKKAIELFN